MAMRTLIFLVSAAAALIVASAPMAATKAPVIKYKDDGFGFILATPKKQALYYWNVEKRAGGKLKCFGACAEAWPPLLTTGKVTAAYRQIATHAKDTCKVDVPEL